MDFQNDHHMKRHDGVVDAHTLEIIKKHPVGSVEGESRDGAAQRSKMLGIARSNSVGRRPGRRSATTTSASSSFRWGLRQDQEPYSQFPSQYLPEAHGFADLMNSRGPAHFGLERLSMSSPYSAPGRARSSWWRRARRARRTRRRATSSIADGNGHFVQRGHDGLQRTGGLERELAREAARRVHPEVIGE